MRLFITIQPDKEFRSALRAVQNELRRRGVEEEELEALRERYIEG